ncbi:LacI family transcriptional regulator [Bordetella pertussis]|nr:LacI family transcriptional regulator [Bordetella pertussis]
MLALDEPPTAVVATNEIVAAGAMSFSDGIVAELLSPALTAVRFPLERMGYLATAMLVDIVEGRGEPQAGLCLPHESVIVRDSTARPPGRKARAATR